MNYGRYLKQCLDSLRAQTFRDFEVILVDGGSSDNTFEVLKDYPEVKVLMDVPAQGVPKAVNKGIGQMQGEYFIQLNSDCWLTPKMYEICVDVLDAWPEYGMVYTNWFKVNDAGKQLGFGGTERSWFQPLKLIRSNYVDSSSMMIRKSVLDALGNFDERYPNTMDWIMAAKIGAAKYHVFSIGVVGFYYRVHPRQITQNSQALADATKARKAISKMFGFRGRLAYAEFQLLSVAKRLST